MLLAVVEEWGSGLLTVCYMRTAECWRMGQMNSCPDSLNSLSMNRLQSMVDYYSHCLGRRPDNLHS
jgi:hypothetical protein